MTQAYKCDICGQCELNEQDVLNNREVVKQETTLNAMPVEIGISIKVYVVHICNTCWALAMQKVKAWVEANV